MGLLDSSDDQVKNQLCYKSAKKYLASLDGELVKYDEAGRDEEAAKSIAMTLKLALIEIHKGKTQFPDFGEWAEMEKVPRELAVELKNKIPDHSTVKDFDKYL